MRSTAEIEAAMRAYDDAWEYASGQLEAVARACMTAALEAADAVAAPAVTVEWLDARIAESEEKQRGQFWAAQLPEAGKVVAYREIRALLTNHGDPTEAEPPLDASPAEPMGERG